jgi:hypothetical protein
VLRDSQLPFPASIIPYCDFSALRFTFHFSPVVFLSCPFVYSCSFVYSCPFFLRDANKSDIRHHTSSNQLKYGSSFSLKAAGISLLFIVAASIKYRVTVPDVARVPVSVYTSQ